MSRRDPDSGIGQRSDDTASEHSNSDIDSDLYLSILEEQEDEVHSVDSAEEDDIDVDPADDVPPAAPAPAAQPPLAIMAAATGSQLNIVQPYDGSTDVHLWIAHLERTQTQFGWNDATLATAAQSKLTGDAAAWLLAQTKANKLFPRFYNVAHEDTSLRPALIARFGERIRQLAALDAVSDLHQRAGETIDAFYDRTRIAIDRLNYLYTAAQKAEQAYLDHFHIQVFVYFGQGMLEEVRNKVLASVNPPVTDVALLEAARAVEAELNRTKKLTAITNDAPKSTEVLLSEITKQLAAIQLPNNQGKGNWNQQPRSGGNRGRGGPSRGSTGGTVGRSCWTCGKTGHMSRNCYQRRSGGSGRQGGPGRPAYGGNRTQRFGSGRGRGGYGYRGFRGNYGRGTNQYGRSAPSRQFQQYAIEEEGDYVDYDYQEDFEYPEN